MVVHYDVAEVGLVSAGALQIGWTSRSTMPAVMPNSVSMESSLPVCIIAM